jgi:hypothetical protein
MYETKRIPEISDEKLTELYNRIKPVLYYEKKEICEHCGSPLSDCYEHSENETGELFYIKDVDARNVAFPWSPTRVNKADDIVSFRETVTYHTWGYYGFFKPTIAEVISQIPEDALDRTVAFLTIGPKDCDEMNKHIEELNDGYHVAKTILFEREKK